MRSTSSQCSFLTSKEDIFEKKIHLLLLSIHDVFVQKIQSYVSNDVDNDYIDNELNLKRYVNFKY